MIYCISDFFYDRFGILFLNFRWSFKFLFLFYLMLMLRCGRRSLFESLFKRVFCCLNVFLCILKKKDRFFRRSFIDLQNFLDLSFENLLVDFKLILFDINKRRIRKKCFCVVRFEDLLQEHDDLYTSAKTILTFLRDLQYLIRKRATSRFRKRSIGFFRKLRIEQTKTKNALIDKKSKEDEKLQPITLRPISVSFEYRRTKGIIFLLKGAKLQEHFCAYIRISREIILSFFMCSISFYVTSEIRQITGLHRYDIKF